MSNTLITTATNIALARYHTGEIDDSALEHTIARYAKFLANLLQDLANDDQPTKNEKELLQPAVPVADSISDDYLICLEDGAKLQMLKRHLRVRFGLTPEEYRRKWDLPPTYPMIAPAYRERKRALARLSGLGTHKRTISRRAA